MDLLFPKFLNGETIANVTEELISQLKIMKKILENEEKKAWEEEKKKKDQEKAKQDQQEKAQEESDHEC